MKNAFHLPVARGNPPEVNQGAMVMDGGLVASPADTARLQQLEAALNRIGVTGAHRSILGLILIGCLFDSFEQNSIGIIGPVLREYWGLSATDIGFLNTITFGLGAAGRLLSGYLADRVGRRTMLTIDLLLFTLGAIICALAPNYGVLAGGRAIVGFGLGGEISVAVTILAEFCSSRFRGTAVGLINVGAGGVGNFLAPAFGLMVFAIFPGPDRWRWLFACLVLPALLGALYRLYIPETPRYLLSRGKVAEANQVLSKLATGRLSSRPATHAYITAPATQAHGKPQHARLSDVVRGKFARRTIPVAIAIWMTYGAQLSVLTMMPTILVAQGYTITRSLMFTMVMQSGSLLGALAASILGYRVPRKLVLLPGAVLACVASLCFGFLANSVGLILLCGATFQFFVLLLNTTIWIYAPELYPTRIRGTGTALILATGTLAGAIMPLAAGRLFDGLGIAGVFGMIAVMYAIFALSVRIAPETFGRSMEDIDLPA
jgi:putative MFS transporter